MNILNIQPRYIGLIGIIGLVMASCSDEYGDGNAQDTGIVTFTASVEKPTSRTTENKWDGNELVGVKIGNEVKTYKVATDGKMSTDETPYEWKGDSLSVMAWTPMIDGQISLTDQSSARKMYDCDLLKSSVKVKSKYVPLTFTHQMTRMKWVIKSHEGYTDEQVNAAKISFIGFGAVTYNNGTISPVGNAEAVISTMNSIGDAGNFGEAIMVPGEVWGQPLIKVEIAGNTYVYTPQKDNQNDAEKQTGVLEANHWQTYYLSVSLKGLSVTMKTDEVSWNNNTYGEDQLADGKFKVTVHSEISSKDSYQINGVNDKGFIADASKGFSITYKETSPSGGIDVKGGDCDKVRTKNAANGTVTFTFSSIQSDLKLAYTTEYMEVGYYLYSDGTFGEDSRDNAVGIIYEIGKHSTDDVANYNNKITKIRGYVVALTDEGGENSEKGYQWQTQSIALWKDAYPEWGIGSGNTTEYKGYPNTQYILSEAGSNASVPAVATAATRNEGGIIPGTSGWYLPSHTQLKGLAALAGKNYSGYVQLSGNYWDSSFDSDNNKYHVVFNNGTISNPGDFWAAATEANKVRLILTF